MISGGKGFKKNLIEWGALGFELSRGAQFLAQMRAMQALTRLTIPGGFPTRNRDKTIEKQLLTSLLALFREDARMFGTGVYPLRMLLPESPVRHGLRAGHVLLDGVRLLRQKKRGRTAEFSEDAAERASEKPGYYQRNFHFQADGYLSDRSAELYEHQVELLFSGTADAMRRLALSPLLERWPDTDGRGLRILEVAAGTGRASRFLKHVFPAAELTVSDLSEVYLKKARANLAGFERVNFVQAPAEALPFRDRGFDAVVSVFLFHELPVEVRAQVLVESVRVLKPGGLVVAVDSVQLRDAPDLAPVLEQFPKDFHEPFYRNYIVSALEEVFRQAGLREVRSAPGFLSKKVWGVSGG